jgi:hypothetical protein
MFKKFGAFMLMASILGLTIGCSNTPKGPVKAEKTDKKIEAPTSEDGDTTAVGIE